MRCVLEIGQMSGCQFLHEKCRLDPQNVDRAVGARYRLAVWQSRPSEAASEPRARSASRRNLLRGLNVADHNRAVLPQLRDIADSLHGLANMADRVDRRGAPQRPPATLSSMARIDGTHLML
jgi:hypothetical protein